MRFTIRLGGFNPPKTLSIYAPFGAGICNTLCTANTCLHYCWYYHIQIRITSGITFLSFVIPIVLLYTERSAFSTASITSPDCLTTNPPKKPSHPLPVSSKEQKNIGFFNLFQLLLIHHLIFIW